MQLCAGFVIMSNGFIRFVKSYRIQDAIIGIYGYHFWAPVWKALGQNKYLEAHFQQLDELFKKFPFSCFQESIYGIDMSEHTMLVLGSKHWLMMSGLKCVTATFL